MNTLESLLTLETAQILEVELYGHGEDHVLVDKDWHILTRILREYGVTQEIAAKSAEGCSWEELQNRQAAFLKMREINIILADEMMNYANR